MVGVLTFNMAGRHAPAALNDLLLPEHLLYLPDVFAIGVQEAFSREPAEMREWCIQLQATLGPSHVLLHSASTGVLHLALFVRLHLTWLCSPPEDDSHLCRPSPPSNLIRTKGAVAIGLHIFGTSLLFVNCHLPAHQQRKRERIEECTRLCTGLQLPSSVIRPLLSSHYSSSDVTSRFDAAFWFGDLNFRLESSADDTLRTLRKLHDTSDPQYSALLEQDQLSAAITAGEAFPRFDEASIRFAPTYKYLVGGHELDVQSARVPSYCDRILFKCKRAGLVHPVLYDSMASVCTSDHKPVLGVYRVKLRPGNEMMPLNAGAYVRDVYLAGLARRRLAHAQLKEPAAPVKTKKGWTPWWGKNN